MEWTTVEWPLGGVDAYTDEKHVQPGKLARVVNGRFTSPPGITKRNGFIQLSLDTNDVDESTTPPPITEGVRIDSHLGEPILFTDRQMYAYSWQLIKWVFKGSASHTLNVRYPGYYDQGNDLIMCSVACNANYMLTLWGSTNSDPLGGGLAFSASVHDMVVPAAVPGTSGTVVTKTSQEFLFDARCFALGVYLYIVMLDASIPATFKITRFQASGASVIIIPTAQNFSPSINTGGGEIPRLWDAREMERNPASGPTRRFLLVYNFYNGSGGEIRVDLWNDGAPPTRVWGPTIIAEEGLHFLTVWGREGEQVFVAWGNSSGQVRCAVLNESTGAVIAAPITVYGLTDDDIVRGSFVRHSSTDVILVWQHRKQPDALGTPPPSKYLPYCQWRRIRNSAGPSLQGDPHVLYDCALITRPWIDPGFSRYYIAACFHEQEQGTGFIVEIGNSTDGATDPRWAGTFGRLTTSGFEGSDGDTEMDQAAGGVFNMLSNAHDMQNPSSSASRTVMFGALQKHKFSKVRQAVNPTTGQVVGDLDEIRFHRGVDVFGIEFANKARFQAASWDKGYFIAGSRPSWYDGFQISEHGFAWYPSYDRDRTGPTDDDIADNVGGVLDTNGTNDAEYQVVATYEHEDVNGMRTQSGVSRVMTEEVTVNNRVLEITRTTSLLTDRIPAQSWLAGTSRPREVFYRTIMDGTEFFRATDHAGFQISDTNAPDTISLGTGSATNPGDADLTDGEQLYTTGDILANDGPPPCRFCVVHGDRLWLGGLENPHEMWFSQPYVSTETPRFNGNLKLRFPTAIVAAESMDDKLVCFSSDRIYIVTGEGVGAAGGADIGFQIQLVTGDLGIKDVRSLVLMRDGLMFRSAKGIFMLERGLGLRFAGKDVRDLADDEPVSVFNPGHEVVGAVVDALQNEVHFVFTPKVEGNSFILVYNYLLDLWTHDVMNRRFSSACMLEVPTFSPRFALLEEDGTVHVRSFGAYEDPGAADEDYIPLLIETPWIKPSTLKQGWSAVRKVLLVGQLPADVDCQIRVQVFYDYKTTADDNVVYTEAELQAVLDASGHYQLELSPKIQTCQVFKLVITDEDSGDGPDQGPSYQSLVFEVGREEGAARTRKEARH